MELDRLPELIAAARAEREARVAVAECGPVRLPRIVERRPSRFQAYVAVMRGCDNFCSYCIVPYVRGREHSRPPEDIAAEVEALAADGCKEVTLLGQSVNSYGRTLNEDITLADLLRRLDPIDGIERLRFVTSHPKDATDELFQAMADLPAVCPHIHLPAQAGANRILERMNRGYTREHYLALVARARAIVADLEIASDFIVGFPGETDAEFEQTVDLVRQAEFQQCFIFKYSPRADTAAARLPDDVPWEVKQARNHRLLAVQEAVMRRRQAAMVGQRLDVLAQGPSKRDPTRLMGRSRANHNVAFPGDPALAGQTVTVEIVESTPLTLIGRIV
jgi:tRNA-2-methylthio-N6-dimethylallyladenosine synthase